MTIKQSEAMKAYQSVNDLNKQKLSSGKLAKQVYDLSSKLKSAFDFQIQEEQKIYNDHPEFDPTIGGIRLEGKSNEERKQCAEEIKQIDKELRELSELDFEIDFEPFDFSLEANNVKISGEDIGNLEKFINFV